MALRFIEIKNKLIRKLIFWCSHYLDYFEEVDFIPKDTYIAELAEDEQQNIFNTFLEDKFNIFPGIVCSYLLLLLKVIYKDKSFNFLDFGARNIDNFAYLNKNMSNIKYFYCDLPQYNEVISKIKNKNLINNLFVLSNVNDVKNIDIDFVFMGSVLQYLENYKKIMEPIFDANPQYIFISGQNCYEKKISDKEYIKYKQLNVLPQINHGLFFHLESFESFFKENGWKLESLSETNFDNYRNFNKINKEVGYIKNLDLMFKRIN
jgi:hypothetical protein